MASIADVFFKAILEDKELQIQAVKAGDKAGQTLGGRMSKGVGIAMKAGLGVVAGAAALATKGLVELDDITAQYTADTGASADEAARARKAILKMSGDNLQPMREIGDTLGKVHTDLDLTGDAADDTAQDFLEFARVTKRDAAEEVASFDDILDAWGLTADHSREIMDKLVVSHQEYGGAIADDEAALASMAPQLKALNLDIDDGIALLNLFKSSGLDAASIPRALNTAIQKLDGRPLEDFIAELSGIEDPGKRAQRAIEIFGSKAGVGLANAIKPGVGSLDDFKISTEDATDATKDARDAIDSTFSNQVKLKIKEVTAKIIEFGDSFGPSLTGLSSLAALGGALGLDRFATLFAQKLGNAGRAGGEALIDGIGTATGAAGTVIGNLVAQALDPHNAFLNGVIGKSAARIGALWGATFAIATKIASAIADVLVKLPGIGAVRSAVLSSSIAIGTLQGTTMGRAAAAAFALAIPLLVAEAAQALKGPLDTLSKQIHDAIFGSTASEFRPQDAGWPLGNRESDASRWFFDHLPEDIRQGAKDAFGIIPEEVGAASAGAADRLKDDLIPALDAIPGAANDAADGVEGLTDATRDATGPTSRLSDAVKELGQESNDTDTQIGYLADTISEELFGDAINAGHLAELKDTHKELLKQRDAAKEGSREYKILTGKIAENEKAMFDLQYTMAQDEGPDAVLSFLRKARERFGKNNTQIQTMIDKLSTLWSKIKRFQGITFAGGGLIFTGIPHYAEGGHYAAGVPRIVGENGPELDVPDHSGYIVPNGSLSMAGMPSGSTTNSWGGVTINGLSVDARGATNPTAVGSAVRQGIHDAMADVLRQQNARLPSGARS